MAKNTAGAAKDEEYVPVHERKSGWSDWEIGDAADALKKAEKIKGNKALLAAIEKHANEKAEEHQATARHAHTLAKRGLVSDKQMEKFGKH